MRLIWVGRETKNFLSWDWTTQITLIRFNKIALCGNRRPAARIGA
jgi:putative transposase